MDNRSSSWNKQRYEIGVPLLPASDLLLPTGVQGQLFYPDDLPITLSHQIFQTPLGPRIGQVSSTGSPSATMTTPWALIRSASDVAGNADTQLMEPYPTVLWFVVIKSFTGTPTNIIYHVEISPDGTTWYNCGLGTAITAPPKLSLYGAGLSAGSTGTAVDLSAGNAIAIPLRGWQTRLVWAFTGGTAPTVSHDIYRTYR